jgi:hypothetical protein
MQQTHAAPCLPRLPAHVAVLRPLQQALGQQRHLPPLRRRQRRRAARPDGARQRVQRGADVDGVERGKLPVEEAGELRPAADRDDLLSQHRRRHAARRAAGVGGGGRRGRAALEQARRRGALALPLLLLLLLLLL